MKKALSLVLFCIIAAVSGSFAVSGIAVSALHSWQGHGIDAHFIENDVWIDSIIMVNANNRLDAKYPQINSYGTHCAFLWHQNDGMWVCVTRIGGVNKLVKKLVKVPNDGEYGDGRLWSNILEWPRGDWVWYSTTKWNNNVWRVNVHTVEAHQVAHFTENSNQMQITGDCKYMIRAGCGGQSLWRLPDADELLTNNSGPVNIVGDCGTWWNDGGNNLANGGCGLGISPSGLHMICNNNGYHSRVGMSRMDPETEEVNKLTSAGVEGNIEWQLWDSWAVDTLLKNPIYSKKSGVYSEIYQSTGTGILTLSGWSSNSDVWTCSPIGWAPAGRDTENGMNLISFNWEREKSLNLTRHPCEFDTINNPEGRVSRAWNGDFWISAPFEDIASTYRDDLSNRDSYTIDGTDSEVMDLPVSILAAPRNQKSKDGHIRWSDNSLVIGAEGAFARIIVKDARGRTVYQTATEGAKIRIPGSRFGKGIYFVGVTTHAGTAFNKTIIGK
ncbi:MAG: hypothetical protein GF350_05055 [Chitinivibrionales bacterium]|nr:hypothetical protein [Chitinivibrionales bacterium]